MMDKRVWLNVVQIQQTLGNIHAYWMNVELSIAVRSIQSISSVTMIAG